MPEYLAPGVYVEETSFRAKSIEGVGTSTTAFVGPTRKGPLASTRRDANGNLPAPPELLTSFGDFVRIYGGLSDLPLGGARPTNFLAHAVLNFFNEGGVRLYVARVANGAAAAGIALAGDLGAPESADRIFIRARTPGASGNGTVTIREILSSATESAMNAAPADTLVRAAGTVPSEPARISGGAAGPFAVPQNAVLRLVLNGVARDVRFRGAHTRATSDDALAAPTTLDDSNRSLTVTLDEGPAQVVQLRAGDYPPAELVDALNAQLVGGFAELAGGGELIIGTDRFGHSGRVRVLQNAAFGFTADADATGTYGRVNNTLPNLANFSVTEFNRMLGDQVEDASNDAELTAAVVGDRLVISTVALGSGQSLSVADPGRTDPTVPSAHAALGFGISTSPSRGSNIRLYRKRDSDDTWRDAADNQLTLPGGDGSALVGSFVNVVATGADADGEQETYEEVSLDPASSRFIGQALGPAGVNRADDLQRLFAFDIGANVNALQLHAALFPTARTSGDSLEGLVSTHTLTGGTNGGEPSVGTPTDDGTYAAALDQLRGLEDISIIAAPGHSAYNTSNYRAIQRALLSHVALPRAYRIAVLDTPPNLLPGEAREERAQFDSSRAALYYPWVTVSNPLARPGREDIPRELNLPPSGFLCGIYARNDVEQTVAKAPANEVVRGALRFETDVNFAQNQLLNPLGVNCLRYFAGRGYRVWGARTASSDPEWKYVNVRRYFLYLEASIDRGTQWIVFENNGERLWANVRETVESFLYNEWVSGNLLGSSPKEAYFVRCDRSTMTQNDLDNGRLICLIGVAVLKPAEFVIFRIGQKTADATA